jgi:hypothetical protein
MGDRTSPDLSRWRIRRVDKTSFAISWAGHTGDRVLCIREGAGALPQHSRRSAQAPRSLRAGVTGSQWLKATHRLCLFPGQRDLWLTNVLPNSGSCKSRRFAATSGNASSVPATTGRTHGKHATDFQPTALDCLPTHPGSGRAPHALVSATQRTPASEWPLAVLQTRTYNLRGCTRYVQRSRLRRQAKCPRPQCAIHAHHSRTAG